MRYEIKNPPAKSFINGIRAIGYSFKTAVADIVDNSISAQSTRIDIIFDPLDKEPFFCILDNGTGMTEEELNNAMLMGSDRSNKNDSELELGRYGLGLKSASLSQCRKFYVVTKQNENINAMGYDLDVIEASNEWRLSLLDTEDIEKLPCVEHLNLITHGTLVIWTDFDRLEATSKYFSHTFRALVDETKKHIELVYHRFYHQIQIYFNNRLIEKRDPFLICNTGRTQVGREIINMDYGTENPIIITPYCLPYANTLTAEEKQFLGNPKKISDDQGFYIYRNKRLIIWGSWLHMTFKKNVTSLARVKVDIPSSLDFIWNLDVKKSSARIPDALKEKMAASINDGIIRSSRTNKYPGKTEDKEGTNIWNRVLQRDRNVKYEINRDYPYMNVIRSKLDNDGLFLFEQLLKEIENRFPKGRVQNDTYDEILITNKPDDDEEDLINSAVCILQNSRDEDIEKQMKLLLMCETFSNLKDKEEEILRRLEMYE